MGKIENSNSNTQCCVPQCKSRSTNEITLFRFPKEESQRKKWTDAIKIEKGTTQNMQVCSRHFVKNDYIISDDGGSKVKRLKKTAVPSQNLPWQFPNKRVSPTLAKARMERLKNRSQLRTSDSPVKSESPAKKPDVKKSEGSKKPEAKRSNSTSDNLDDLEPKSEEMSETDEKEVDEKAILNTSVDVKDEEDDDIEENEEAVEKKGDEAMEAKNDEDKMTRAPTRLRQRKGVLKCEYCGRKCLTPQALQTHQQTAHKNARNNFINPKKEPTTNNKPKSSPKPILVPLISVKSTESLQQIPKVKPLERSLNTSEVEKELQEDSDYMDTVSESSESSVKKKTVQKTGQRKAEFECPICKRRFAVFFMANKHIQKYHSGPHNGSKMPLLPKPNRIEICTSCDTTLDSNVHVCAGPLKLALGFICTGCEQEYKTLTLFDMHKSSRHNDGVESMFFPALDEFEVWKQRMEAQTRAKYAILDQNDMKKIYRCIHHTALGPGNNSRQRMCPSSVVVQEFTKGFQVHYYPNHFDHAYEKYSLGKAFQKYSISSLMNRTASKIPDSDEDEQSEDLYVQFKKITSILVNEAARINVNGLKKLMRKALDMMAIVNSYVEDEDEDVITSSVIKLDPDKDDLQDEVKKALMSLKRPIERIDAPSEVTPAKRRKSVFQSTENTLKTKEVVRFAPNVKDEERENNFEKREAKVNQSPSFIDTFQDFVGKSLVKPVEKKKRISDGKKTPMVKTKIGQFKPKSPPIKALSPKNPPIKALSPKNPPIKALSTKNPPIKALSPKNPPIKASPKIPPIKAHSPKSSIKALSPKSSPIRALSPKSPKTNVSSRKSSVKEIKYEVKEQENDCNILILKI